MKPYDIQKKEEREKSVKDRVAVVWDQEANLECKEDETLVE